MMKVFRDNFFWGGVLSILLVIGFVSVTVWKTTIPTTPQSPEHEAKLHSLFLSGESDESWLRVASGGKNLDILNWLIVWNSNLTGIGGWDKNSINWEDWAIAWWYNNKVSWKNWIVWWWYGNINEGLLWVVVWWRNNKIKGDKGVILWGLDNVGWGDSFVMWTNATWEEESFAWSAIAPQKTARIDALSGVLIWTKLPIMGVKLVIGGAAKLRNYSNKYDLNDDLKVDVEDVNYVIECIGSGCYDRKYDFDDDGNVGENDKLLISNCVESQECRIGLVRTWIVFKNGHIVMYDGSDPRILGRTGSSLWDESCGCWFGTVRLNVWDVVKLYSSSYATDCEAENNVFYGKCKSNWEMDRKGYPYCYEISDDPRLTQERPGWWVRPRIIPGWWERTGNIVHGLDWLEVVGGYIDQWQGIGG